MSVVVAPVAPASVGPVLVVTAPVVAVAAASVVVALVVVEVKVEAKEFAPGDIRIASSHVVVHQVLESKAPLLASD